MALVFIMSTSISSALVGIELKKNKEFNDDF